MIGAMRERRFPHRVERHTERSGEKTMSADGTIGPALAELRLRPDLQDLQSGILIRGMDGTLYWVSDDLLNKSVLNDGCLMPITDQPLRGEPLTEENRIRQVLQD